MLNPPPSVPRSVMPPLLQRTARKSGGSSSSPGTDALSPTTSPRLLIARARLKMSPGKVPRSTIDCPCTGCAAASSPRIAVEPMIPNANRLMTSCLSALAARVNPAASLARAPPEDTGRTRPGEVTGGCTARSTPGGTGIPERPEGSARLLEPRCLPDQELSLGRTGRDGRGRAVLLSRGLEVAGHLEQVRANGGDAVVPREARVGFERAEPLEPLDRPVHHGSRD